MLNIRIVDWVQAKSDSHGPMERAAILRTGHANVTTKLIRAEAEKAE